jgi:hypothetical protein
MLISMRWIVWSMLELLCTEVHDLTKNDARGMCR